MDPIYKILSRYFEWGPFFAVLVVATLSYSKKRYLLTTLAVTMALIWLKFSNTAVIIINSLGTDSFIEARRFDANEALFYVKTLFEFFQVGALSWKKFIILLFGYSAISATIIWILKRQSKKLLISLAMGVFILTGGVKIALLIKGIFYTHTQYTKLKDNFNIEGVELGKFSPNPINVIIYIGESTTAMNMSLYGYWRNTTPELLKIEKNNSRFLKIKRVFATHTHTTPSLLEALSIPHVNDDNKLNSIYDQKRIPLPSVLKNNGIEVSLITNHGMGSWNYIPQLIFRSIKTITFGNKKVKYAGNYSDQMEKPFDHDLFSENVPRHLEELVKDKPKMIVFQSYTGHGPYSEFIPKEFVKPVDDKLRKYKVKGIIGNAGSDKLIKRIENYDMDMFYIDSSLSKSIHYVENLNEPTVFIYFADHGDSAYSGRAHDSSRFVHEMARVPFFVFFNKEAKKEYPHLFETINQYRSKKFMTLRSLVPMIMKIFGGEKVIKDQYGPNIHSDPILVRDILDGRKEYITPSLQFDDKKWHNQSSFINATDSATNHFRTAQLGNPICFHRSNTVGKLLRGAFSSNCVEIDVVVNNKDNISITHPPVADTGFKLDDVFEILDRNPVHIWIDAKNINNPTQCKSLVENLKKKKWDKQTILVEFPSDSSFDNLRLLQCSKELAQLGVQTSYYVPTRKLLDCENEKLNCDMLNSHLNQIIKSGGVQGLSFDYRGISAMKSFDLIENIKWHTWNIKFAQIKELNLKQFGFIIPINKDPNNL